jgi:ribonuclease P protein component
MINRSHRFHGYNSLRRTYGSGQSVRGSLLSLKYAHTNRNSWRAAVVVSRKVNGSAVVRNRIRRRVYETVRKLSPNITEPYDMVITIYDDAVTDLPQKKLEELVVDKLVAAKILKSSPSL